MPKLVAKPFLFAALLFTGYLYIGYFIPRTDTIPLLSVFTLLFGAYLWITYYVPENDISQCEDERDKSNSYHDAGDTLWDQTPYRNDG